MLVPLNADQAARRSHQLSFAWVHCGTRRGARARAVVVVTMPGLISLAAACWQMLVHAWMTPSAVMVLAAMAVRLKRLGPCMLAHATFNLVAVLAIASLHT